MTNNELLELMQTRQSSRAPFDPKREIPPEDLRRILEAARWSPTAHNMQNFELLVIDDHAVLEELAKLETRGADPAFIRQNYAQLSFSEDELKRRKVGLLATMFPPAWRTPDPVVDGKPGRLGDPVRSCSAIVLVLFDPARRAPGNDADLLNAMSLGCVMENMWLMAASLGIGFHIQSSLATQPVEDELKEVLHIPKPLRIAFGLRLGYPTKSVEYLRVRRDVSDFAHRNGYETRF